MQLVWIKMRVERVKSILLDWTMRNLFAYELVTHLLQCELASNKESLVVRINSVKIADIQPKRLQFWLHIFFIKNDGDVLVDKVFDKGCLFATRQEEVLKRWKFHHLIVFCLRTIAGRKESKDFRRRISFFIYKMHFFYTFEPREVLMQDDLLRDENPSKLIKQSHEDDFSLDANIVISDIAVLIANFLL